MGFDQIQEEMAKRTFSPVIGFVELRLGVHRTKDMVMEIAMRWKKSSENGWVRSEIHGCGSKHGDVQYAEREGSYVLREFVLSQEEAYEVKIGKQEFRRPGDPPLDDVVDKPQAKQSKDDGDGNSKNDVTKDEL